jgi:amino acid transporter
MDNDSTTWCWITIVATALYAALIWFLVRGVKRGRGSALLAAGVIALASVIFLFIVMQWASWYK